ncbi:MAG TPA: hypothetical protein VGM78_07730, partial [Ilumatobacteraceae bacterium]
MTPVVPWTAPSPIAEVLAGIGRTEDVCFFAGGGRIAVAGYGRNVVQVLDVDITRDPAGDGEEATARINVTGIVELSCPAFDEPHGLHTLDDHTIVVANRSGDLVLVAAPPPRTEARSETVEPVLVLTCAEHGLTSPGSVAAARLAPDLYEIIVCNGGEANTVSRHVIDTRGGYRVVGEEAFIRAGISVADSVGLSPDRRWIAVSSHYTQCVLIYANSPSLDVESHASGVLQNVTYPHGVRFTADGRHVVVADAGAPYVHVFARGDDWTGVYQPVATRRLMGDEVYLRGRTNPQEGGPKGIDLHPTLHLLATTALHQELAFFDLRQILPDGDLSGPEVADEGELARIAILRAHDTSARTAAGSARTEQDLSAQLADAAASAA